jgi:ubiquinone/menaquinone biosynthesis C-methylase UbiE
MDNQLFDSWSSRYDQWFETPVGALVKRYESDMLKELVRPAPGEKILDVGCGTGIFTLDILDAGPEIMGVDISEPMLRVAAHKARRHPFHVACCDMCALPFANDSFDKAFSMTALEFVEDAQKAIDELERVVRTGGLIVVTTLNSLSPWAERRLRAAQNGHSLFQKIFFRSPNEMRSLAPTTPTIKTAIHFLKEDPPTRIPQIERQGQLEQSDKGAFLAVQWVKA